jgi:hypothetical protein
MRPASRPRPDEVETQSAAPFRCPLTHSAPAIQDQLSSAEPTCARYQLGVNVTIPRILLTQSVSNSAILQCDIRSSDPR